MLTLETLSEQGARLSVRDRLWLIWRLVRSLFGRSSGEVGGNSGIVAPTPLRRSALEIIETGRSIAGIRSTEEIQNELYTLRSEKE